MTRQCLTCSFAAMRSRSDAKRDESLRNLARSGMVNCTASVAAASFHLHTHTCDKWKPARESVVEERRKWAQRLAA